MPFRLSVLQAGLALQRTVLFPAHVPALLGRFWQGWRLQGLKSSVRGPSFSLMLSHLECMGYPTPLHCRGGP